jgi:glutamine amidotransferase
MMKKNIVILDYGLGNVKSISNALRKIGIEPNLTSNLDLILKADSLILPGVGAFSKGIDNLKQKGLFEAIHEYVKTGKPLLGICLGMQMLMDQSEEFGTNNGLGLIKGKVIKLPNSKDFKEKIPHVSWNEINEPKIGLWNETILDRIDNKSDFYFVHSFYTVPKFESNILATTNYAGIDFCSAIQNENVFGTQFHPEKSGKMGLLILSNFINLKI